MNPAIEISITLPVRGGEWEYAVTQDGCLIASSEGEASFTKSVEAFKAALHHAHRVVSERGQA